MSIADDNLSDQTMAGVRRRQIMSAGFLLAGIVVLTGLTWQSVTDMVTIWLRDSAYNHGLFILPIAAFMAWERRERLAGLSIEPYWPGIIIVAGFAFTWLASRGASIMEGEQISYVGMVQGLILTVLGRKIFRAQLLPILYLWLLVPTGGFLIPGLQAIATWLAQNLLQLTSIPFFVEQFYFQLPVGLFFVAPGCAGLNFLLAALALSIVYVDLVFVGWKRKIICILIWLGVAILANGVRIFGILWIAEISNRQLDIVDDHILYGWGFFIIILIGLMYVGQRFSNMPPLTADTIKRDWLPTGAASIGKTGIAALAPVLISAGIISYGYLAFSQEVPVQGWTVTVPQSAGEWRFSKEFGYSENAFPKADVRRVIHFETPTAQANLFIAHYSGQWEGHEAVSDNHNILGEQELKITGRAMPEVLLNGTQRRVIEETVSGGSGNILMWRWYCAGSYFTTSRMEVRLRAAANRMFFRSSPATVFTMFTQDTPDTRANMTSLMQALAGSDPGIMVVDAQGTVIGNAVCR